jgi:hypothetical protein
MRDFVTFVHFNLVIIILEGLQWGNWFLLERSLLNIVKANAVRFLGTLSQKRHKLLTLSQLGDFSVKRIGSF